MDIAFVVGEPVRAEGPLGRFLPPLELGTVERVIGREGWAGKVVLDPFGSSPQLAIEAAQAGAAVVVACNNPVTRFLLERRLDPLSHEELQAGLSRLASMEKDGQRLEPFVLELYATHCLRCGERVPADYFVWNAESQVPILKAYACIHCGHAGEDPVDERDLEAAAAYPRQGLTYAQALEAVAPVGDPNRQHAEAALAVYPGRALYAIVTLINKAEQVRLEGREAVALHALLLSSFDAADSMWAHPEGRSRPKQLSPSPQFKEINVWRALERAVGTWAWDPSGVGIRWWPESGPPTPSAVAIFSGSVRQLASTLPDDFDGVLLTVPPRPNQAFWTLSALWTAWIWGREASEPIRAALRRRRYDWGWHAGALRSTVAHLTEVLPAAIPAYVFVPEAEPRFVGACAAGLDAAGLALEGLALRVDERQAQMRLHVGPSPAGLTTWQAVAAELPGWLESRICQRGEPTPYGVLFAEAAGRLAKARGFGWIWGMTSEPPVSELHRQLEQVLAEPRTFIRLDQRQDPESGIYWLTDPQGAAAPLADRVEREVVEALRRRGGWDPIELDREICRHLPGLQTPDRELILACLASYGLTDDLGHWSLRPEDRDAQRQQDVRSIRADLASLGENLGYAVAGQDPIHWRLHAEHQYSFHIQESAILSQPQPGDQQALVYVVPGGRSGLIAEKAKRDPRLAQRLATGLQVVKFRHIRRLHSDTTLTRETLIERMGIDPPEHQEPQLPLL
jgi:hypothetical protein